MEKQLAIILDSVGRRYGVRPSQLVGLDVAGLELVALSFDFKIATIGAEYEHEQMKDMREGRTLPPGLPSIDEMEAFFADLPEDSLVRKRALEIKNRGRRDD